MSEYWALSDDIGAQIQLKIENYRENLRMLPLMDLWRNAWNGVNRALLHLGDVLAIGENGEYSGVYVNNYRSLTESKLNMIFSQTPKFDCKAINTDYKSQTAAKLGNGLLEYYLKEKKLEHVLRKVVTQAYQIYGQMFLTIYWDVNGGKEYGVRDDGSIIRDGDIAYQISPPQLVARDYMSKSNEECEWHIVTSFVNKYGLAAKYPEHRDHIISLSFDYLNE